ncbi:biliverdin-producing heme oxygenase [Pseudomonas sp. 21LCFQ010]|uniref:biliverdin-producing heme oxygenase n=1 Tax=Pseudomonas sp. 21LCFQ010 TaxID=2957506 RepID=UPI002097AE75|nr:biliverdin-producing heme oxygenase [Pseudomonas sp. 21LCFQ010]MCO8165761.1 biliverdin-producing heme oxygenase [Pseudomonas sp. 21LCFQ010]
MSATPLCQALPSVLAALRAQTGQMHSGLEKRMPFFSARLDLSLYTRLIQAYYGFYQPLEAALLSCAWLPAGLDLGERLKVPTLLRDLQALAVEQPDRLALCTRLPAIESPASVLGVLYVLEGATLGGQVLRREMHARLGLDEHSGAAFLDVYGRDTGRRWKAYLSLLDEQPTDAQFLQAAALAAESTFACFEQWLDCQEILS